MIGGDIVLELINARVIVTGASKGIGRLITELLLEKGAKVLGVARSAEKLRELEERYERFYGFVCDLSKLDCCSIIVNRALEIFGGIDVLINNAGFAIYGEVWEQEWQDIEKQLIVNMVSAICLTRRIIEYMLRENNGTIVFILTGAVFAPILGLSAYGASKSGLSYFAETLRHELDGTNIRVLNVYLGEVKGTEFFNNPSFKRIGKRECKFFCTNARIVAERVVRAIEEDKHGRLYIPRILWLAAKTSHILDIAMSF